MVDSIAVTSLVGYKPLRQGFPIKDASYTRKPSNNCRFLLTEFMGGSVACSSAPPLQRLEGRRLGDMAIEALATGLTKEAYPYREKERFPRTLNYLIDIDVDQKPRSLPPVNGADDPSSHNPLRRRYGCLCGIFEWEGVIVEDNWHLEELAWRALFHEEGKSRPAGKILKRIERMKNNEQAISEVLHWSRDPREVSRMAARKEEIYQGLQGGICRLRRGSIQFAYNLIYDDIPVVLVSTLPKKTLKSAVRTIGMQYCFSKTFAAEDVHGGKPVPEMFSHAAKFFQFIPERCIVFGNSNQTAEAAHDARMKCVAVASKHPVHELTAADLAVRHLHELSVDDLKKLAGIN